YCGVKHAIATNNGTTALHVALVALGVGAGDEVIVPSLTYIATANAVKYCNGAPVLVDNDPITFNIDPADIEAAITPRTKGIIPVHLYGHPADMDAINAVAKKHGLFVLEDAAEAAGASYKGRKTGGLGDVATFSFFGNKIITTGEGGMVTTDDDALAARIRLLRGQGMDSERRYWFPVIGYNYRMTNIQAAIGLGQLERIEHHLEQRRRVAAAYRARLAPLEDRLILPTAENWAEHVYWMYTVVLKDNVAKSRDQVMADVDAENIETRPVFYPMHVLPPYEDLNRPAGFPHADRCAERGINLPTFGTLTEDEIERVAAALERSLA
ncbi:MAG: DegT/DnrJ/EryC1/StrS family aminotransferase, partial [Caulobacteraceae bacterium]